MEINAVFDTNILIDYLIGVEEAKKIIDIYSIKYISIISWMEILVGVEKNSEEEIRIKGFLLKFKVVFVDTKISEIAVDIKRKQRIKLPDAIIWATAIFNNTKLITRNTKDFSINESNIIVPYTI